MDIHNGMRLAAGLTHYFYFNSHCVLLIQNVLSHYSHLSLGRLSGAIYSGGFKSVLFVQKSKDASE